jgi:two-component system, response regulator
LNAHTPVDILFIEDNPQDSELTLRALKKHNVTERCIRLTDGAEALDYLFCRGKYHQREITNTPKVVLLDLKLPKIDGLEVLREIKTDKRTKTIPVVMVTSSRQDNDMKTAYAFGANSYIVKPLDFHSFTETISFITQYWLNINKSPF